MGARQHLADRLRPDLGGQQPADLGDDERRALVVAPVAVLAAVALAAIAGARTVAVDSGHVVGVDAPAPWRAAIDMVLQRVPA